MKHLKLAQKNRVVDSESWTQIYENKILKKIRKRYSLAQELAIQRKRDTEPEAFAIFNAYVEQCIAEVKAEMEVDN